MGIKKHRSAAVGGRRVRPPGSASVHAAVTCPDVTCDIGSVSKIDCFKIEEREITEESWRTAWLFTCHGLAAGTRATWLLVDTSRL